MFNSPVQDIKDRLDIVEVVSGYIQLARAGQNWKALCPFHNEKTSSFVVSPEKQIWHCFGCGEGGDIFTFVMKMEGIEFRDALRILAKRAGVELKAQDPKLQSQKTRLFQICQWAGRFFVAYFEQTQQGKKAKEYLKARGLSEGIIKEFQIGYAPKSWDALLKFLKEKGFKEDEILKAGLLVEQRNENSSLKKYYDRFRNRIIFPIFNSNGESVGFGGRIMPDAPDEDKTAKYINTSETLIYNKRKILYGFDKAKTHIRKKDFCVLVEGYADLIASHQAGVKNVVASSGTALTIEQINLIKRQTNNLAIAFDTDSAGVAATKRSIALALEQEMSVKIIKIDEKDPADCVKENPEEWKKAAENAISVMDFYFESAFSSFNAKDLQGKKEITSALLPVIKKIPNKIEQAHWIGKLAKKLEADEKNLIEEMKRSAPQPHIYSAIAKKEISNAVLRSDRIQNLQEQLLGFFLIWQEELKEFIQKTEADLFFESELAEIFEQLKKNSNFSEELKEKIKFLKLKAEYALGKGFKDDFDEKKVPFEEVKYCLDELKNKKIKDQLKKIEQDIKKAEEAKDNESRKLLAQEFNKLSKELN